jgi:hypothetical protein
MSKVSQEGNLNLFWYVDKKNPKILINILGLFETHLDSDSSRFFADFKKKTMNNYMQRGYQPNTLMSEVSKAADDYEVLKEMFKLQ